MSVEVRLSRPLFPEPVATASWVVGSEVRYYPMPEVEYVRSDKQGDVLPGKAPDGLAYVYEYGVISSLGWRTCYVGSTGNPRERTAEHNSRPVSEYLRRHLARCRDDKHLVEPVVMVVNVVGPFPRRGALMLEGILGRTWVKSTVPRWDYVFWGVR